MSAKVRRRIDHAEEEEDDDEDTAQASALRRRQQPTASACEFWANLLREPGESENEDDASFEDDVGDGDPGPASSHTKKRPVSANRDAPGRVHAASGADLSQRSVDVPGRVPSSAIPVPIPEVESRTERKTRRRKELELEQRRKNSDGSVVEPARRRPDVVEGRAREAEIDAGIVAANDQAKKRQRQRTTNC